MRDTPPSPDPRPHRLWWWLGAVVLALGGLLVALLWAERSQLEKEERARLAQQAAALHDNITLQLTAVNQTLGHIVNQLPRWRAQNGRGLPLNERLSSFTDAMAGVNTMLLLDSQGMVQASNRPELVGSDLSHRAYFALAREARTSDVLFVSPPFEPAPGVWVMTLARIVPSADGGFGGMVTASLEAEAFRPLLQAVRYTPDISVVLAHGDGLRFLTQGAQHGPSGVNVAQPGFPFAVHMDSRKSVSEYFGTLPSNTYASLIALHTIQPVALAMDKPLVVGVGRPWPAVIAPWKARAWAAGVIYLLASGGAAIALLVLQQRQRDQAAHQRALSQHWRGVLEATRQGAWEWDMRSNQVYFSPAWKAMLGYAEHEIADDFAQWERLVHPDDLQRARSDLHDHVVGQTPFYENAHRLLRKDGSYLWTQARGAVVERDAQGQPLKVIGTQFDINERHQLQERLDRLTVNLPGALYQYQLEPDGRSHFPYASGGVFDIYGLTPEELRQDASLAFARLHPADLAHVQTSITQSAQTQSLWHDEFRINTPAHGERWLLGQAQPQLLEGGAILWHGYLQDITEAKRQALQLQDTERLLRHLMQEMPLGLCMVDELGRFYFRNRRFLEYFGYNETEELTLERWWREVYPDPSYRQEVQHTWNGALELARAEDGVIPSHEYRVSARDGAQRIMVISGLLFANHMLITFEDRTEQQAQTELLRHLAFVDGLTSIANRRQFDQQLQAEWRRCRRSHQPLAVVLIDIDHFKQYNDHYGHQQGDACLQAVAETLRHNLGRSHDLVARYGGEEFVCLLPESDLPGALAKAQALCQAVQALGMAHAGSAVAPVVTISAGVACEVPSEASSPKALLIRADTHLYLAKQAGRNRVDGGLDLLS